MLGVLLMCDVEEERPAFFIRLDPCVSEGLIINSISQVHAHSIRGKGDGPLVVTHGCRMILVQVTVTSRQGV